MVAACADSLAVPGRLARRDGEKRGYGLEREDGDGDGEIDGDGVAFGRPLAAVLPWAALLALSSAAFILAMSRP